MIFVTGATGLVGQHIVQLLLNAGYGLKCLKREESNISVIPDPEKKIQWVDGDLLDWESLKHHIKGVDQVLHCAAQVDFGGDDDYLYKVNIEGTQNIVNACLLYQVPDLVFISSVAALGKNHSIITEKNEKWDDTAKASPYAISKYFAEKEVWRGQAEGLNTLIINPPVVLGSGSWDRSSGKLFHYVKSGKPFYTDFYLNYIDARDLAQVVFQLIQDKTVNQRFIVSAGQVKVIDFFCLVAAALQKKAPFIKVPTMLLQMASAINTLLAPLFFQKPILSKELVLSIKKPVVYSSEKLISYMPGLTFTSLQDSVNWVVGQMAAKNRGV